MLLIGAIAAILNQTVLNVALPTLSEEFNVSTATAQWLITLYMLVNGIFIPITAFLMARFSTRQLFFTSMIVFSIGTLICGIAPSFTLLLTGRVVQAIGAGIVMPLLISVVFRLFPMEKRGAAMGIVGVAIMFAPAIGPTLSGFLITTLSWRFIFFAILPFSLSALIAAFFVLKNVSEPTTCQARYLGRNYVNVRLRRYFIRVRYSWQSGLGQFNCHNSPNDRCNLTHIICHTTTEYRRATH